MRTIARYRRRNIYEHVRADFPGDLGLLIVGIFVLFWHPQHSRTKASTPADRQSTRIIFRDDDQYWPGDFFYINPKVCASACNAHGMRNEIEGALSRALIVPCA